METQFDVIVIGSGPAGGSIAGKCANAGKKTAVVDVEFGGTCALKGCTPKKVLAVTSEILRYACHLSGKGIKQINVDLDWGSLMHFKRSFTELIPMHTKEAFTKNGITVIEGSATFVDANIIEVAGKRYKAKKIAVATGAVPAALPFNGAELMITSDQLLELDQVPKKVVFVGGGYIALEFAQILRKSGCEVTILEASDLPVDKFDHFLVSKLCESFQMDGIDIRTNFTVEEIRKENDHFAVQGHHEHGNVSIDCDLVVHGAGRMPNIKTLNLEKAGVKYSKKGISVKSSMQSVSNPDVYCAGDVADTGFPFTLVADYEGHLVATNILEKDSAKKKTSYHGVPYVLFTAPKLASVGMLENELIEKRINYTTKQKDTSHWLISRSLQEHYSGYKIFIGEKGEILGAHLIGPKADEVINGFAMAIQHNLSADDIKKTFMSYPSAFSEIRKMI